MIRPTLGRVGIAAAALALPLGLAATPAQADGHMSTVSVLHAIPEGSGADVVDVLKVGTLQERVLRARRAGLKARLSCDEARIELMSALGQAAPPPPTPWGGDDDDDD